MDVVVSLLNLLFRTKESFSQLLGCRLLRAPAGICLRISQRTVLQPFPKDCMGGWCVGVNRSVPTWKHPALRWSARPPVHLHCGFTSPSAQSRWLTPP